MTSHWNDSDADEVIHALHEKVTELTRVQQERVRLTAKATSRDGAVSITVNANGTVIETRFGPAAEDLEYRKLAQRVTTTAQRAVEELRRKTDELMADIVEGHNRLPKLYELIEGMPNFDDETLLRAPGMLVTERDDGASGDDEPMTFTGVEPHVPGENGSGGATESVW